MTKTQIEKLETLLKDTSFDGFNADEKIEGFYAFMGHLSEMINQHEVIYYETAIEYLLKNDPSLRDSIDLAKNLGFELHQINSELLATLYQQENMHEELEDLKPQIEAIFGEE